MCIRDRYIYVNFCEGSTYFKPYMELFQDKKTFKQNWCLDTTTTLSEHCRRRSKHKILFFEMRLNEILELKQNLLATGY